MISRHAPLILQFNARKMRHEVMVPRPATAAAGVPLLFSPVPPVRGPIAPLVVIVVIILVRVRDRCWRR